MFGGFKINFYICGVIIKTEVMWPFRKKFNHNPEDFRLEIVESWFSEDYVEFRYSANGGKSWKNIYHANPPFLGNIDYDWKWETLTYELGSGDFRAERERFSSYQKILDYEKEQEKKYYEGQESVIRQRNLNKQQRLNALKRANS